MLNVSYLKTYGYIMVKRSDDKGYLKCLIHPANCLYAIIWHGKENKLAHLVDFFSDTKHLERCLKYEIFKNKYKKIVIYTNTDFREKYKIVQLFTKYGYNVEMKACKRWKRYAKK